MLLQQQLVFLSLEKYSALGNFSKSLFYMQNIICKQDSKRIVEIKVFCKRRNIDVFLIRSLA